ncbi:MAG: response regulator [Bacillota bacterium]
MASKPNVGMGKWVLVVDDRRAVCSLVERVLGRDGFNVRTAMDGQSALAIAQSDPPRMAIVDYVLPGNMTGLELLGLIKKLWPDTKCVLMSGAYCDFRNLSESAAVDAVLIKPFEVEDLRRTVMALTER